MNALLEIASGGGELLLHAEDQHGLRLLTPLLARLIVKTPETRLHVPSLASAHIPMLLAAGFSPDETGRMVLGR
jgi:hypothetical protein